MTNTIEKLESLANATREMLLRFYPDNPSLSGNCERAHILLCNYLLEEQKSNRLDGSLSGVDTEVYFEPWSSGGTPLAQHKLTSYIGSDGQEYILDPTITQFPFLVSEEKKYVFTEGEYPWHLVRKTLTHHLSDSEQQL